jgi:hypothetical protein
MLALLNRSEAALDLVQALQIELGAAIKGVDTVLLDCSKWHRVY